MIQRSRVYGFTLVELIISIVVISIALSGTLIATNIASKYSSDPMVSRQAVSIAQSYLDEILTKKFPTTLPCPAPPGGGRSVYKNVCDYQGLVDVGPKDQTGTAVSGLEAYTVTVAIDDTAAVLGTLTTGTQVVRVDVTVTRTAMPSVKVSGYRTSY